MNSEGRKYDIVLADPDRLFREALANTLATHGHRVIQTAGSLKEIPLDKLGEAESPILIVDFDESDGSAMAAIAAAKSAQPRLKTMVISGALSPSRMRECLEIGVDTCLRKDVSFESFLQYLGFVGMGESVFPTEFVRSVLLEREVPRSRIPAGNGLPKQFSPRELAILKYLTEGASNKMIARYLGIADATVKVNLKAICRKLNVRNRTQAATWAVHHDIRGRSLSGAGGIPSVPAFARADTTTAPPH